MTEGKPRSRAALAFAAAAAVLVLGSCVYFNTMYNARRIFSEAEELRGETEGRSERRGLNDKYNEVVIKCSKILRDHPESSWVDDAVFLMGKALVRQGELSKGIRKFQELIANYPESEYVPRAHYWLALANLEKLEYTQAMVHINRFLEDYPDHEIRNRVLFLAGDINLEQGNDQEALHYYSMVAGAAEDQEAMEEAVLRQARLYYRFEEWERAAESYESLLHKGISWEERYRYSLRLGDCYIETGKCAEALALYDEILPLVTKVQDEAPVLLGRAAGYSCMDSLDAAMKEYESVTRKFPRSIFSSEAFYRLGLIYHERLDSLQLAQEAFEKAAQESSTSDFSMIAGQKASSIKRLLELQQEDGAGSSTERLAEKRFMAAEIQLTRLGETSRAVENYRAVVDSFPDSRFAPMAAYALGFIFSREFQDSTGAVDAWADLVRRYPRSPQARGALEKMAAVGGDSLVSGLYAYVDSAMADTAGVAEELRRRREIAALDSIRLASALEESEGESPDRPGTVVLPPPARGGTGEMEGSDIMRSGRFTPGLIRVIRQRKFEELRRRMWGAPEAPADTTSAGGGVTRP